MRPLLFLVIGLAGCAPRAPVVEGLSAVTLSLSVDSPDTVESAPTSVQVPAAPCAPRVQEKPKDPSDLLFYVNRQQAIPADYPVSPVSIWSPCPDPNGAVIPFPGGDHDLTCVPALYTYNTREAMRRPAFESPAPAEVAVTFDGLPVGRQGKIGFKALMDAARDAGHGIFIRSAFRAYAMQSATFSMWVSREVIAGRSREEATRRVAASSARAGHSEHQLGTTADLVYRTPQATIYDGWDPETIASSLPMQWVAANAHRFGIVLTYDRDHVDVTQYVWEPWHYRFVGVEAANAMKECGLSTEEFMQRRYAAEPPPPYSPRPPRTAKR